VYDGAGSNLNRYESCCQFFIDDWCVGNDEGTNGTGVGDEKSMVAEDDGREEPAGAAIAE
jgi:hypothetical protein